MTALVAAWHPVAQAPSAPDGVTGWVAHLHGRELAVWPDPVGGRWRWRVESSHGTALGDGDAPDRIAAERAAEDEATAVHPPTDLLLDRLLS
jgi:hypothetical protein